MIKLAQKSQNKYKPKATNLLRLYSMMDGIKNIAHENISKVLIAEKNEMSFSKVEIMHIKAIILTYDVYFLVALLINIIFVTALSQTDI